MEESSRRIAWSAISTLALVLVGLIALKFYEDGMRSRERGRLVSSIVDQQFRQLSPANPASEAGTSGDSLDSGDSANLRRWLVREAFSPNETPADLARRVQSIVLTNRQARWLSPTMKESLNRWTSTLLSWSAEMRERGSQPDRPPNLLEEARQRYFEAVGYQKIGKPYDAAVLHLWTISLLTRFIDRDPFDSNVPEALFMLGMMYLNLGHALPPRMRRDRILNLCGELYPDSLWANRSNAVWREVFADEI